MRSSTSSTRLPASYPPGAVVLTTPVAAEITFGIERLEKGSRRRRNLEAEYRRLRDAIRWSDWTDEAAIIFGLVHEIHRVTGFEKVRAYTLRVAFEDGTEQVIDFRPVLRGELFGDLIDEAVFDQVRLDKAINTLVWPNGADFDPAILHDWPQYGPEMSQLADAWDEPPAARTR
jgi:predicted nucleic acid-binding protein